MSHPLQGLQEYALEHITRDADDWTRSTAIQILTDFLVPLSLSHYPETYLPPEDDDLVPLLLDDWKLKGLLAKDGDFFQQTWEIKKEALEWMKGTKKAAAEAGKKFTRARVLCIQGPYTTPIPRPLSPILTRRAIRESPRINDSTFVDPLLPTSLDQLNHPTLLQHIVSDEFDAEPLSMVSEDEVLNLRPELSAEEVQQVGVLLSSIPLPKKKEKKKNPITIAAQERRDSAAAVLDASWGEKSRGVREEMRERCRSMSPPVFPRLLTSDYHRAHKPDSSSSSSKPSSKDEKSPPPASSRLPSSMSELSRRLTSTVHAFQPSPVYDEKTGKLFEEKETDELDDDPFSMHTLDVFQKAPMVPSDLDMSPPSSSTGVDAFDFTPYLVSSSPEGQDLDEEDLSDMEVPEIPRMETLKAARGDDKLAPPSTLQDAVSRVFDPNAQSEPAPDPLAQLLIQDIEDPPSRNAPSASLVVEAGTEPSSQVDVASERDLVLETLSMLPGGKEEIGRSAESWIERDDWDQLAADHLEVPDLPSGRSYFLPSSSIPTSSKDLVLPRQTNPAEVAETDWRLSTLVGSQSLSLELPWRPFLNTYPEDDVLPINSLFDPESIEAYQVKTLLESHSDLFSGLSPDSIIQEHLPSSNPDEWGLRRGKLGEDDVLVYTRRELAIKQQRQSGKRKIDQVEDKEDEIDPSGDEEEQVEDVLEETTVRTEIRISQGPPRRRRLSAIDADSDREEIPMEGLTFQLSPSPPSSSSDASARPTNVTMSVQPVPFSAIIQEEEPKSLEAQVVEPEPQPQAASNGPSLFGTPPQISGAVTKKGAGLAHFLLSRGRKFEPRHAPVLLQVRDHPPPPSPNPTAEEEAAQSNSAVEDKTPLPVNLPEFDTAWISGGVEPGANGKTPPVLHVVSGQRLLQNRSASRSLRDSLVLAHHRTHDLLSSSLSRSNSLGLDLLIGPLAAIIITPLRTLGANVNDLHAYIPGLSSKLDRLFIILTLPDRDELEHWTVPVKSAVGKLRRGIAMLDLGRPGGGEGAMVVKVGWAGEKEIGRLTRGLTLGEVDAGRGRGGEESWTGSWLGAKEEEEDDEWEEEELDLAKNDVLNPYTAAFILSLLTTDQFLALDDDMRLEMFGSLLGQARVSRLNASFLARRLALEQQSSPLLSPLPPSSPPTGYSPLHEPLGLGLDLVGLTPDAFSDVEIADDSGARHGGHQSLSAIDELEEEEVMAQEVSGAFGGGGGRGYQQQQQQSFGWGKQGGRVWDVYD